MKSLSPLLGILLLLPLSSFAQSANVPPAPLDNSGFEDRHPEGMFSSIVTAHGQEMVMGQARSFQIVPVKPTKTFSADVPEIFVVFSLQQHDSEFKLYGRWVVERGDGTPPNHVLGTDAMILMTEDVVWGRPVPPFNHPAAIELELAIVLLEGEDDEDFGHVCGKRLGRLDRHDLETAGLPHDHLLAMGRHDRGEHALRVTIFKAAVVERSRRDIGGLCEGGKREQEQDAEERRQRFHSPPFCT